MDRLTELKKSVGTYSLEELFENHNDTISFIVSFFITVILFLIYYGLRLHLPPIVHIQVEGEESNTFTVGDKVKFRVQLPRWNCLHLLSGTWSIKNFKGAIISREADNRVLVVGKDYIVLDASHVGEKDDPTLNLVQLQLIFITPGEYMMVVPADSGQENGEKAFYCFDVVTGECDYDTTYIADLECPAVLLCLSNARKCFSNQRRYENILNIKTIDAFMNPTTKFNISEFSVDYLSFTYDKKALSFKFYDNTASAHYTDDQFPVILKFRLDRPGIHRLCVTYRQCPIKNGDFTTFVVDYQELMGITEYSGERAFPAVLLDPRIIDIGRVQLNASFRLRHGSGLLAIDRLGDKGHPVATVELPVKEIKIRLLYFKNESEPYTFLLSRVPKNCTCLKDIEIRNGMVVVRMAPLYARAMIAQICAMRCQDDDELRSECESCKSLCEPPKNWIECCSEEEEDFTSIIAATRERILLKDDANNNSDDEELNIFKLEYRT